MKNGTGVEAERLNSNWTLDPEIKLSPIQGSSLKRAMDLLFTVPLLIVASPFFLLIALLVKFTSKGNAIFSHTRIGRNGESFKCYKFRSMHPDAESRLQSVLESDPAIAAEWEEFQKLRNDPRVTKVGAFLRRTSLDELPQLFNILRGDMSVIGPRPVTKKEMQRYGADVVYYYAARPGVLGLWQVNGRNELSYDERVAYDIEYVKTWGLHKDLMILLKAVPVVLFGRGAF